MIQFQYFEVDIYVREIKEEPIETKFRKPRMYSKVCHFYNRGFCKDDEEFLHQHREED